MTATLLRIVAVLLLLNAAVSAQSLADVARREEARRKTIHTPGKLYTNDSLHREPASAPAQDSGVPGAAAQPVQPPSGGTQPAAEQKTGEPKAATDEKKDQNYWKQRLATERDALERSKTFADALQSRINALTTDFVNRDDPAQRNVIAADRQKALAELNRVNSEIQQHTKAITDIQEDGRKSGVPAGWLR